MRFLAFMAGLALLPRAIVGVLGLVLIVLILMGML